MVDNVTHLILLDLMERLLWAVYSGSKIIAAVSACLAPPTQRRDVPKATLLLIVVARIYCNMFQTEIVLATVGGSQFFGTMVVKHVCVCPIKRTLHALLFSVDTNTSRGIFSRCPGGLVYRGSKFADLLYGKYIFNEFQMGGLHYISDEFGMVSGGAIIFPDAPLIVAYAEDLDVSTRPTTVLLIV